MRILVGTTRLDMDAVDAYRQEESTVGPQIRVFFSGGGYLCLSPKYENISLEEIIKKLDENFLGGV